MAAVAALLCVRLCARNKTLLVSQLVRDGEGQWEARVLANAATAMWLAHPRHVGQTQSFTGHVDGCTDVLPLENEDGELVREDKEQHF